MTIFGVVVVVGEIFMEGDDVGGSSGCMGVLSCCRYGVGGGGVVLGMVVVVLLWGWLW